MESYPAPTNGAAEQGLGGDADWRAGGARSTDAGALTGARPRIDGGPATAAIVCRLAEVRTPARVVAGETAFDSRRMVNVGRLVAGLCSVGFPYTASGFAVASG